MIYKYDIKNIKPNHILSVIQSKSYSSQLVSFQSFGDELCVEFEPHLTDEESLDLEESLLNRQFVKVKGEPPFTDKKVDGKNLFNRTTGSSFAVTQTTQDLIFVVPFPEMKFNGIEVVNATLGDSVNLYVLDSVNGDYTGVPNYQLNQFGYTVFPAEKYYPRKSKYDADVLQDMQILVEYTSVDAKTVYLNFDIHEVKA